MLKKYTWYSEKSDIYSKFPKLLRNEIDKPLMDSLDIEVDNMKAAYLDLFNQFFISTATWGLDYWENLAGILVRNDLSLRLRRENILNALRNRDITTVNVIKSLAESYSGGECEVKEIFKDYKFTVKFIGTRGVPAELSSLTEAIEKVKPAHLGYEYIFTYMTWDECTRYHKTWTQWEDLNLTWEEFERYYQGYKVDFLEWARFEKYNRSWQIWDTKWLTWDDLEIYV